MKHALQIDCTLTSAVSLIASIHLVPSRFLSVRLNPGDVCLDTTSCTDSLDK